MTTAPRTLTIDEPVCRVVVEYLNTHGGVRHTTVLGPWRETAAKGQATATRNAATRNGGKVRTKLQRVTGWETIEEVTE